MCQSLRRQVRIRAHENIPTDPLMVDGSARLRIATSWSGWRRRWSRRSSWLGFGSCRTSRTGLRQLVGSPGPFSRLRWRLGFPVVASGWRTVEAWTPSQGGCGSPSNLPDAAFMRPTWPGCWPWNGSPVVSWRSLSWISRSRRPGRSVGRCMVRSLGAGFSAPGESPPSCVGLLALGGLESIGGIRAGVGRLGRVRLLPVLGLPERRYT